MRNNCHNCPIRPVDVAGMKRPFITRRYGAAPGHRPGAALMPAEFGTWLQPGCNMSLRLPSGCDEICHCNRHRVRFRLDPGRLNPHTDPGKEGRTALPVHVLTTLQPSRTTCHRTQRDPRTWHRACFNRQHPVVWPERRTRTRWPDCGRCPARTSGPEPSPPCRCVTSARRDEVNRAPDQHWISASWPGWGLSRPATANVTRTTRSPTLDVCADPAGSHALSDCA